MKNKKSKSDMKDRTKQKDVEVRKKRMITFAIIAIIVLSALGYMFWDYKISKKNISPYKGNVTDIIEVNGDIVSYKYNNFQFEKRDNMWLTQIQMGKQPYIITLTYGPIYIENVSMEFKENYFPALTKPGRKVYVTFDHDSSDASYIATSSINLITNLKTVYGVNVERGCLKNSTNCAGAPIVTCENSPNNAVIQFIEDDKITHALYDGNCLTIWASKDNFIRATEKIILNWYGVI